jgi:class 3 adenylate cyclase/tetratricopeptide (TPR) repeat protein
MVTCPTCGQQNPEAARFCNNCATPLAAQPQREERKVVTVLFCDLVGSTARAEQMDPEDVRAALAFYHERVRRELQRFGGTVEKFIGDAVMALFGAPVAHEDDPERAVRAGLAIRDWAQEEGDLQVRIGVTTGEALVALGVRPEAGEGMVSGDVVNSAARLESAAPVNGILVDEATYRATERLIDFGPEERIEAKGKAGPVPARAVLQARARVRVERAGRAPLVGREKELEVLVAALTRAREDREPQLVTLIGVPGIGKSRLVYELFKAIEAGGVLTFWRHGRSLPYGEGVSFWALAEIVKAQAGVLETDDPARADTKLRESVAAVATDAAEADWILRNLRPLLGLESGGEIGPDRRDEAFAAWRRFFEALAEQRPLVLVVEDLHFADDGLVDFVDYLVDWATGVPILIVATARPELLARRQGWGGGKANATTLSLAALSDEETARLVRELLARRFVEPELLERLLERAGGNPLYAEEFARTLQDRGEAGELPETVQGLIAARIDGLPPQEKELLQDGAVLGRMFWLGAAQALAGVDRRTAEQLLHALERKEFVRRERRSAVAGETEYAFRHLLVRDVAYGQIPRAARAGKHRRAAEWIESLGRPADHAELLAHHYVGALELLRAAGRPFDEVVEPARKALSAAAERAFALNAYAEAVGYYEAALELGSDGRGGLLLRYGSALSLAGDTRFEEILGQAADELLAAGDRDDAAEAHAFLAEALHQRGERDRAYVHIERAVELVRDVPASPAKVKVFAEWSRMLVLGERPHDGIAIANEAFRDAESLGLIELAARTLGTAGVARSRFLGDHRGGLEDLERSIEIARSVSSPEAARAHHNLHISFWWLGELDRAVAGLEEAVRIYERLGGVPWARASRAVLSWLRYFTAHWEEARAGADAVIAESEAGGATYFEYLPRLARARIRLARAEPEELVVADLRRAVDVGRARRDPQAHLTALAMTPRIWLELGRADEARAAAEELVGLVGPMTRTGFGLALLENAWVAEELELDDVLRDVLESDISMTDVWRRPFEAVLDGDYAAAAELFGAMGYVEEGVCRLRAAEQLAAGGRHGEADEQASRALAFFAPLGATRYVRQAEALQGLARGPGRGTARR